MPAITTTRDTAMGIVHTRARFQDWDVSDVAGTAGTTEESLTPRAV